MRTQDRLTVLEAKVKELEAEIAFLKLNQSVYMPVPITPYNPSPFQPTWPPLPVGINPYPTFWMTPPTGGAAHYKTVMA